MSDGVVDAKLVEEMTIEGEEEAPEVEVAEGEPAAEGAAKKKKKKKKKKKNTEANQQNGTIVLSNQRREFISSIRI